jgi:hypothetical protein
MTLLRRILWYLSPFSRTRRSGYTSEVLYAGWVHTKAISAARGRPLRNRS